MGELFDLSRPRAYRVSVEIADPSNAKPDAAIVVFQVK